MANRILRDWTDSEKMHKLTSQSERFFTRLIMKADDFGCYTANPKLLLSALFPLSEDIRPIDVSKWLNECAEVGLVILYQVDGKNYLQICDFGQRLRLKKARHPLPHESITRADDRTMRADDSNVPPETETEVETEVEKKAIRVFGDFYTSGAEAFNHIKNDELFVERLQRVVSSNGFQTSPVAVMYAVKKFITTEEAKPEFLYKPKDEVRRHLVNWLNKNAHRVNEYAGV